MNLIENNAFGKTHLPMVKVQHAKSQQHTPVGFWAQSTMDGIWCRVHNVCLISVPSIASVATVTTAN